MKKYGLLFVTALLFGLGGCVPKSKLDEAQTKLADAETKLAKAEARIAEFEQKISQGRETYDGNVAENAALKKQFAEQAALLVAQTETLKKELTKSALLADEIVTLKKQLTEQAGQSAMQAESLQKELDSAKKQLTETSDKLAQKQPLPVTVIFERPRQHLLSRTPAGYVVKFRTTIKQDFQVTISVKSKSFGTTYEKPVALSWSQPPVVLDSSVFDGDEITIKHAEYQDKTVVCPVSQ